VKLGSASTPENKPSRADLEILKWDGTIMAEWKGSPYGKLSPNGEAVAEVIDGPRRDTTQFLATYDSRTGRLLKKSAFEALSIDSVSTGFDWLNDDEFLVRADTPEETGTFGYYAINSKSGKSTRLRGVDLNHLGQEHPVVLGRMRPAN
jgi:hypothetical protein